MPDSTATLALPQSAPRTVCRNDWCTDHADGTPPGRTPDPADQLCTRVVTGDAFGEFLLTYSQADGLNLCLYNTNLELSDDDALKFISAVTAAIAMARAGTAVPR